MATADAPPKKGGRLKWVIIVLLLLLLGAGGAWYYFLSGLPGSRGASADPTAATTKVVATSPAPNLTTTLLAPFLVNLADPLGKRYIKLTLEVEITSPQVAQELEKQTPKIRDSVIMLLSSKSYADLAPTESKLQLKNEITDRLNQILGGPKVSRVFFVDMVIQ